MIRCRSCLIPDTRPDTQFTDGICSACLNFQKRKSIDWSGRGRLLKIALEIGKNDSGFTCIVPSSGGKDSHYQVLRLIELGARPLVVTASTCYLTPIGRKNIDNLARYATTIEFTPQREVRKKLNLLGLETVGDISYPEHLAIFSIPFQAAVKFGIPLIFFGESPQQEYGCPSGAEEALTMTRRWVAEFGGLLGMRAVDMIGLNGITAHDMLDYMLPDDDKLQQVTAYFLGQFEPWDSHRNASVACKAGMNQTLPSIANWWEAENQDNAMIGLHDHAMYRKYGYGRLAAQLSVDIRNNLVTRKEALEIAQERDGVFPWKYMGVPVEEIERHLGITHDQLIQHLDHFTNWDLFKTTEDDRPLLREIDNG